MRDPVAGVARAIATAGAIVALDQATKQAVIASISRGDSENVFFGLDFTNTRNTGVASSPAASDASQRWARRATEIR